MAGVALGHIHIHFTWQAWHLRPWAGSGGAPGFSADAVDASALCVAGGALTALGELWSRTGFSADAVDAAALCVAGVALGDIHLRFTWQAWHLRHWASSGRTPGSQLTPWKPRLFAWQAWHLVTSTFTLRGRRGTWSHPHSFHVAGVALTGLGGLWWRTRFSADVVGCRGSLRGRRGTW